MPEPGPPAPPGADRWKAWDSFLEAAPGAGFMQSSWWADFRATTGYGHFGVVVKDRGAIVGGAVVLRFSWADESCFYYMPEGPVLPGGEAAAGEVFEAVLADVEARRRAEGRTVSHLRMEPRWPRLPGFVRGFRAVPAFRDIYMEPRNTLCVDLRPSEEAILARMKQKGRYSVRVAQRHGVSVVEGTSGRDIEDFLAIYGETAARQGLDAKPPEYFQALVPMLSSLGRGSVFFAEHQGERLAAAVVVRFGRRATYFFGGSLGSRRHVMAPYLLQFEIMRWAKALGCEWYDLWGVAPEGEPDHPWRSISVFKRKFGGQEVGLVPTLDYVYDPAAYDGYLAAEGGPAGE